MKTAELTGAAIDWAAAEANGTPVYRSRKTLTRMDVAGRPLWLPSTDWAQGGPIIEREGIELLCNLTATEAARFKEAHADWQAFYRQRRSTEQRSYATTPLIAAMRCYVMSVLGDEVDVPAELVEG